MQWTTRCSQQQQIIDIIRSKWRRWPDCKHFAIATKSWSSSSPAPNPTTQQLNSLQVSFNRIGLFQWISFSALSHCCAVHDQTEVGDDDGQDMPPGALIAIMRPIMIISLWLPNGRRSHALSDLALPEICGNVVVDHHILQFNHLLMMLKLWNGFGYIFIAAPCPSTSYS